MLFKTGNATAGHAGHVDILVGEGNSDKAVIDMVAGKTTDEQTGGFIALTTGFSKFTSSGNIFPPPSTPASAFRARSHFAPALLPSATQA